MIMFLEDFQDNVSDFQKSANVGALMMKHYLTKMPALIVFIFPYSLMLSLLWALGKMSKSQELVSIIQTGRSVVRLTRPLALVGVVCTIICIIFNYHWAPHASFPYNLNQGEPLKAVEILVMNEDHNATQKIFADEAIWTLETGQWTFINPVIFDLTPEAIAINKSPTLSPKMVTTWEETPWQIIKPGLKAHDLGVPGLKSWLVNHFDHPLSNKRAYQTHLHYRIAQPFICLIIILLAAPLGIVLNKRGVGGGIAVAIFLCAGMIFCSTVFPTLGESGYLSPIFAAWATNILFGFVALILFYRRITGQPIYQTIKNLMPNSHS